MFPKQCQVKVKLALPDALYSSAMGRGLQLHAQVMYKGPEIFFILIYGLDLCKSSKLVKYQTGNILNLFLHHRNTQKETEIFLCSQFLHQNTSYFSMLFH